MALSNILKGISGEFEIIRSLGALGVVTFIAGVHVFEGYEVFYAGKGFDLIAYCAAFPAGLSAALLTISGSASVKDRNIAVAKNVQDQGAVNVGELPPGAKIA